MNSSQIVHVQFKFTVKNFKHNPVYNVAEAIMYWQKHKQNVKAEHLHRMGCTFKKLASKAWRTWPEPYKHLCMCIKSAVSPAPNYVTNFCLQQCFPTTESQCLFSPHSAPALAGDPLMPPCSCSLNTLYLSKTTGLCRLNGCQKTPSKPSACLDNQRPITLVLPCLRSQPLCSKWSHPDELHN